MPGLLIYKYTKKIKYLERSDRNFISILVKNCFGDDKFSDLPSTSQSSKAQHKINHTIFRECVLLSYCFIGLMVSYLTWGLLQEKIMTRQYSSVDGKTKVYFKDSQFLVFANRLLAFVISGSYLYFQKRQGHGVPLFKYSYASFSNILSTWCQYESLKFVSFPAQVLTKSSKIIPVMLMGKIISRNKYQLYEYLTAGMISFGMFFFLFGSYDESKSSPVTTISGFFLLVLYMVFDSFTSNWQSDLFKTYGISSIQMMCGVNLFSTLFTAASLYMQGGFTESLNFCSENPAFLFDCIVLSISSACGQLFIFYTISKFGAVVFTIIMACRQAIAILLSCIVYGHKISVIGIFGIIVVFLAIFLRVYCSHRVKILKRRIQDPGPSADKQRLIV